MTRPLVAVAVAIAFVLGTAGRSRADDKMRTKEEDDARDGDGRLVQGSKNFGIHTPWGRTIYKSDESFDTVVDSKRRIFIIEVATGVGAEGNLGFAVGWLPRQLHFRGKNVGLRLELYAGAGVEINPAYQISGAVRGVFHLWGYRPYIGLGYFYKDVYRTDVYAHHAFVEAGYSWKLGQTYHLTAGLGLARILAAGVRSTSVLRTEEVDIASLEQQIEDLTPYRPLLSVRFSRAF